MEFVFWFRKLDPLTLLEKDTFSIIDSFPLSQMTNTEVPAPPIITEIHNLYVSGPKLSSKLF